MTMYVKQFVCAQYMMIFGSNVIVFKCLSYYFIIRQHFVFFTINCKFRISVTSVKYILHLVKLD